MKHDGFCQRFFAIEIGREFYCTGCSIMEIVGGIIAQLAFDMFFCLKEVRNVED